MNKNLGEIIREQRRAKGLSLPQLSRVSGVSASFIGRIETGERFPSAHTLRKLAKPLGFGEVELFQLADFLSDDRQDRIDRLKREIKTEIVYALDHFVRKVDSL